jgi:hypothetical protein
MNKLFSRVINFIKRMNPKNIEEKSNTTVDKLPNIPNKMIDNIQDKHVSKSEYKMKSFFKLPKNLNKQKGNKISKYPLKNKIKEFGDFDRDNVLNKHRLKK